ESYDSAKLVARALRLWYRGGAAAGDIGFWAPHADLFDSPRAYALVINALLDRRDFVASMALLIHWLEHVPRIGLRLGGSSLPLLAIRWLVRLRMAAGIRTDDFDAVDPGDATEGPQEPLVENAWPLAHKFLDYLEANAESLWSAPKFALGSGKRKPRDWDAELGNLPSDWMVDADTDVDMPLSEQLTFDAAYEDVIYEDTTDDGHDGPVFGNAHSKADEDQDDLEAE